MDLSPPIFLPDPSSVCWRPCSLLPAQVHTEQSPFCAALPPRCCACCRTCWLGSLGEGRTGTGAGAPAGSGCWGGSWKKPTKKRQQTARAPSSSADVSERRKDTKFCASLRRLLGSRKFTMLMICIISINAVSLALETSYRSRLCRGTFFEVTDAFCIAIHTTELLLKLYVDPIAYWKSSYNILDAAILLVAFLPHASPADTAACTHLEGTTEGLQTLRILKPIKRGSGMRVFTETLGQTVQTVMYALILLFLLMCVFAVLGHGWYGDPKTGDIENWGSLKAALFTLFSLVTVDGWTDLQRKMDHYGFMSSHVFIVVFILLGHFIFFSILIALVITKTQDLTQKHEQDCKAAKKAAVWAKRQKILKKRGKNVSNQVTLEQHKIAQGEGFSELLDDIKKTLHLSDVIIMEGFCFTIPFIDLYLPFLDLQDDTLNRLQHHYYKRTGILMEIVEVTKEKSLPDHEKTKS